MSDQLSDMIAVVFALYPAFWFTKITNRASVFEALQHQTHAWQSMILATELGNDRSAKLSVWLPSASPPAQLVIRH